MPSDVRPAGLVANSQRPVQVQLQVSLLTVDALEGWLEGLVPAGAAGLVTVGAAGGSRGGVIVI